MTDLRDPVQFNAAYRRLFPGAMKTANGVLRDEAAAEDVVQDVFMQLWLRPSLYDPARGSLASYVSMLTRSRALDRWRTRGVRDTAVERAGRQDLVLSPPAEDAAEPVIRRERTRTLLGALTELPSDQREALLLAYGRGLTAREIADVKRVPLGTAKGRVRLGLDKARANLRAAA
jgi:RNA polymerase sigma-70 factor (ECF subfamily)